MRAAWLVVALVAAGSVYALVQASRLDWSHVEPEAPHVSPWIH